MTIEVGVEIAYTTGCCGVRQLTGFSTPGEDDSDDGWDISVTGSTVEEAYKNLFDEVYGNQQKWFGPKYFTCSVIQVWFRKRKRYDGSFEDTYDAQPFMDLIAAIPDVLCLGEVKNVNSGNMIKGYQWVVA